MTPRSSVSAKAGRVALDAMSWLSGCMLGQHRARAVPPNLASALGPKTNVRRHTCLLHASIANGARGRRASAGRHMSFRNSGTVGQAPRIMWASVSLRLSTLFLGAAACLACGSRGPESCQALETCCATLEGPQSTSCRDGLEQALASQANEADLDAACVGSLRAFSAAGLCEAPEAPAGGLQLDVLGASFLPRSGFELERAKLLVVISLQNKSGGAPAFLSPTFFTVGTKEGVAVAAQLTSELPQSCAPDLALLADGEVQCLLVFAVPSGLLPISLSYTNPDGRLATAAIPKCSAASSDGGFCPEGELCSAGRCAVPCSYEAPNGACALSEERCIGGSCKSPCGPDSFDGFCEAGICVDGTCDQGCFEPHGLTLECADCFRASGCVEAGVACGDQCLSCLQEPTPSARCACQADWCGSCLTALGACFRASCPEC